MAAESRHGREIQPGCEMRRIAAALFIREEWFRDLDSNQDTQLQRLMSYRLDDPGSAGRNCSRGMPGCTDSAAGRVNAAARVEESRAQPRVRVLTSANCQNASRAVSEV